jgi:hypothetical protein
MSGEHLDAILAITLDLLRQASEADSPLNPTDFYCEGWMTALTLAVVNDNCIDLPPFCVVEGGRWWREVGLRSPISNIGTTWADAVLGHFDRRKQTKRGIQIRPNATQFVVIEAKINAPLSAKTAHADDFDQVARYVASMAFELGIAQVDFSLFGSLGFYVVSSNEYVATHQCLVKRDSIERKVWARIADYDEPRRTDMERWFQDPFHRLLDHLTLECITWESVIQRTRQAAPEQGELLNAFYQQCRKLA